MKTIFALIKETFYAWYEDRAPRMGAALAYYSVFSLAPLLVIATSIAGFLFGAEAARKEALKLVRESTGESAEKAVQFLLEQVGSTGSSTIATVIAVITMLVGASGLFAELQDSLNMIWKVPPKSDGTRGSIFRFVKNRLLAFVMVLSIGFLVLVSLIVTAGLQAAGRFVSAGGIDDNLRQWQLVNSGLSFLVVTLFVAMIFKFLPDVAISWKDVWVGSAVTAVLFVVGKYLIGLYLGHTAITSAYGAAASLVVILIWIYYSAQILLLGAEFTRAYAIRRGRQVVPDKRVVGIRIEEKARQR